MNFGTSEPKQMLTRDKAFVSFIYELWEFADGRKFGAQYDNTREQNYFPKYIEMFPIGKG